MPELPEVETTRRGLAPHLRGTRVTGLEVRQPRLRWPVPAAVEESLGREILDVRRRAKYLLIDTVPGSLVLHLGMSGSLRLAPRGAPPDTHDHVDLELSSNRLLRFNDPRRFGCLLWQPAETTLSQLRGLGPEPLEAGFDGDWLWRRSRNRRAAVKSFLMDQRIVVGVGNIYAAEALFAAGIHPRRAAGRISLERYRCLAGAVRAVLEAAIRAGGTTLRDFTADGRPGYFTRELAVYGRGGAPCRRCGADLKQETIGQRASVWCPRCQR